MYFTEIILRTPQIAGKYSKLGFSFGYFSYIFTKEFFPQLIWRKIFKNIVKLVGEKFWIDSTKHLSSESIVKIPAFINCKSYFHIKSSGYSFLMHVHHFLMHGHDSGAQIFCVQGRTAYVNKIRFPHRGYYQPLAHLVLRKDDIQCLKVNMQTLLWGISW